MTPKFYCLECGSKKTVWCIDRVFCSDCKRDVRAKKRFFTELTHKIMRYWEYVRYPEKYPGGVY
jgi:hypothetical protein